MEDIPTRFSDISLGELILSIPFLVAQDIHDRYASSFSGGRIATPQTAIDQGPKVPKFDNFIEWEDGVFNKVKAWISMVDHDQSFEIPIRTRQHCWWCRNPFPSSPLGVPVKFHSHSEQMAKYQRTCDLIGVRKDPPPFFEDFFTTVGIFCSFPCANAFIIDNPMDHKLRESQTLLRMLYRMYHTHPKYGKMDATTARERAMRIPVAPNWRLLGQYGGHLSIEDFRSGFNFVEYSFNHNYYNPVKQVTLGLVFQEHRKM